MIALNDKQIELQALAKNVADTSIQAHAATTDNTEEYPWNNVKTLTHAGFMGMTIPKEFGGRGFNYLDAVIVIEQMARACGVTGRIVVEANMGAIGAIMQYGNNSQKQLASKLVFEWR